MSTGIRVSCGSNILACNGSNHTLPEMTILGLQLQNNGLSCVVLVEIGKKSVLSRNPMIEMP